MVVFTRNSASEIQLLFWIHFTALLVHQFEEYTYPGGFKHFYNEFIRNKSPITKYPLNDNGVLLVNIGIGWTSYVLSAILWNRFIWFGIGLLGVTFLNGTMHTIMYFAKRKYNPGLISGIFILIPFVILSLYIVREHLIIENLILGFITFVIGAAFIPFSIKLTN